MLVTAAGDLRIAEPLSGFELTAAPERHSIDGLDTQNVRFERINEDGFFESYSIAVLSGPEVAATLKAPESMEYVAVEAFTVNGSQVYSRHRDFGTEFPIYEFAWGISDHEAVAVLTQYLDEDELLKVVASLEVAR
ncbi:hypothetical protein [Ilumatobacter sp.]|uniref:hypothetical protein n=1 Tax=Ilumatobacter sp. TaxID=1967498 RepID=UPI00263569E9|nr:hypothetical protein [Ilumatobacter sp.]